MYDADKSGWTDRIWYSAENSNVVCWEYRVIESLRS